jgi:hypothetical protein
VAVTRTVPQDELRHRMLQAARGSGIAVLAGERDKVGWLLDEAAREAGVGLPWVRPGYPVTGQHLRVFLAYLVERDLGGWARADVFVSEASARAGDWTQRGLVEALRRLTDHSPTYGDLFPEVTAYFLDLPLQLLVDDGSQWLMQRQGEDPVTVPYTIVRINEHYLATVSRSPDRSTSPQPLLPAGEPVTRAAHLEALARRRAAARTLRYLAGNPDVDPDPGEQRKMLLTWLGGPLAAGAAYRRAALELLRAADDVVLGELFGDGEELRDLLRARIPVGDPLRDALDGFIGSRFRGGWKALDAGTVDPTGQPRLPFSPGFLDPALEGVGSAQALSGPDVTPVLEVLARAGSEQIIVQLRRLPLVQRARAGPWLRSVWVEAQDGSESAGEALPTLEKVLTWVDREAADQVPDRAALSLLTLVPPAEKITALRAAIGAEADADNYSIEAMSDEDTSAEDSSAEDAGDDHAAGDDVPAGEEAAGVAASKDSAGEAFKADLRKAYDAAISAGLRKFVKGKGPDERKAQGLHSMHDIGEIAKQAKQWTDEVFGRFVTRPALVPDRPGKPGNIHDQFVHANEQIENMDEDEDRLLRRAAAELRDWLYNGAPYVGDVLAQHGARPVFNVAGNPVNADALLVGAVIENILRDTTKVMEVLHIWRGWEGLANPETHEVWIQTIKSRKDHENQYFLWDTAQTFVHEYIHLLQHEDYFRYAKTVGSDAYNTLVEGVASFLTEIVWSRVSPRVGQRRVREAIEGDFVRAEALGAGMPSVVRRRYPSYAKVMKLLQAVGDVRNLYAAFFLGEVEKIAGPIGFALAGSPERPLPADELAAGPWRPDRRVP